MTTLLIVESPGKIKKIESLLGAGYTAISSVGHIKGLDPKTLGIDIANQYTPEYITISGKESILTKLRAAARKANHIYLCADADREGEMIAHSIAQELDIASDALQRATFTEITRPAITRALENPRAMDMNLVHAQQARAVLDKLIGYKISPVLWAQLRNHKLSAGRVQSIVVRLLLDREREIVGFAGSPFYNLAATFTLATRQSKPIRLDAQCISKFAGQSPANADHIEPILAECARADHIFTLESVSESHHERRPPAPYITSSLQQDASARLGLKPTRCMRLAQDLYEAGHITYMRTDSPALSTEILKEIAAYITATYGTEYHKWVAYKSRTSNSQEAHEACRPTHIAVHNIPAMTAQHNRLYGMIWRRTVASQMSAYRFSTLTCLIRGSSPHALLFKSACDAPIFAGYMVLYGRGTGGDGDGETEEDENEAKTLAANGQYTAIKKYAHEGDGVICEELLAEERWTRPPNMRYNEAGIIRKLEELEIGRPATYAQMITKVEERGYAEIATIDPLLLDAVDLRWERASGGGAIVRASRQVEWGGDKNKLTVTNLGVMVTDLLMKEFSAMMEYGFTAQVEQALDKIASGEYIWWKVVDSVYQVILPKILELSSRPAVQKGGGAPDAASANRNIYRILGSDPATNAQVAIVKCRTGYAISVADAAAKKKYRYAPITPAELDTLELAVALKRLELPRVLGIYNNVDVILARGKSLYIKYGDVNINLKGHTDADAVRLQDAIKVIGEYVDVKSRDIRRGVYMIRYGPYSPYIEYEKKRYPVPKNKRETVGELTEAECKIIVETPKKPSAGRRMFRAKKGKAKK
jgi:DNA topoisomerase I